MATENGESGDDLDGPTFTIGDPVPQSALHDHPRAAMDKGVSFDEMDYQSEPPFPLRWSSECFCCRSHALHLSQEAPAQKAQAPSSPPSQEAQLSRQ
ncbi:hypothetical protein GBAR_LOCUS4842 [Geodia barretti]|uniref:Uncharacterized protein n=1 Tax=Geodia barretti TaxID=519541 RepID=A0AA35W9G5_GEOBA|nr:hypothetical protein GBAR_LOCUS4842 [Geodia barretti]